MTSDTDQPDLDEQTSQYLTFILGGEEYGVDILKVQEIRGWESATNIPNTPEYVLGVVNLRGLVVPIVDLRLRFSLENADFDHATVVVIVKVAQGDAERTVGMVVDAISDVYVVKNSEVREAPDFGGAMATEFIKGLTTVDEKMVVLLDVDHLVNAGVLEVNQNIDKKNAESETISTD
jgi:purine-binding chemotaxis protein CheW